jgi:hypothetical protein
MYSDLSTSKYTSAKQVKELKDQDIHIYLDSLVIEFPAIKPRGVQKRFYSCGVEPNCFDSQHFVTIFQVEIPLSNGWKRSEQGLHLVHFSFAGHICFEN